MSFLGNGTVEIWDVYSGQMEYTLEVNLDGSVGNFEFSPSSQELVASSFPKDITLWDVNTGQLIKTITPNNGVTTKSHSRDDHFAYSPDGTKLATRNLNNEIEIWDTETGDLKSTLQAGNWTFNLVFSSDGQYLASTESIADQVTSKKPDETKIKIWNVSTGQLVKTLENKLYVRDITFSPDGKQLAVASQPNEIIDPAAIILWDIDSEEVVQTLSGHTMIMVRFEYLLEGRVLISSSYDGTIRIWGVPIN
jgi:WD40 repeat protein